MAKLTKTTLFKTPKPAAETSMDKTTRAVRAMTDEAAEQRQTKSARLRKMRLAKEVNESVKPIEKAPVRARKKSATKVIKKA